MTAGNTGDMRTVPTRHEADIDDLRLAIGLYDERHPLGDRRCGIVDAEIADVEAHLVVGHRNLIGKAVVLVRVDPHQVGSRVPEDSKGAAAAGWVAVAV